MNPMEVGPSHNFASALLPEDDSCWKFRTRFEKILFLGIIVVVIFSVTLVSFVIFVAIKMSNNKGNDQVSHDSHMSLLYYNQHDQSLNFNSLLQNGSKVCLSPGCVIAASELLNLLDENVRPCDDFYSFVCGGWIKTTPIPDDSGITSMFDKSRDRLDIQLKTIVESPDENLQIPAVTTLKNMYKSCMNLSAIEKIGKEPLRKTLALLGGWPIVEEQWNEDNFDWIKTIAAMRSMGYSVNMFMNFKIIADVANNSRNIIHMDEPVLGLRKQIMDEHFNNSILVGYYQLMVDCAVMLGAKNLTKVAHEMREIIELEKELSNLMHDPNLADTKPAFYVNLTNIVNMANADNNVRLGEEWIRYINAVFQLKNGTIKRNEIIITDNLQMIEGLDLILGYLNKTKRRAMANYMLWRIVFQSLGTGDSSMREMRRKLYEDLYGITERPPRWEICLNQLGGSLSLALSSLYIKQRFDHKSKLSASLMIQYIKDEFVDIIKNIDWMDNETRKNALLKAKTMKSIVGHPSELANDTLVNKHFEDLSLSEYQFEENIRKITKWSKDREFNALRKRNDPHYWKRYADSAKVNAFYQPQANSIVIPAGILRDVFFNAERPQYLNFGTIGFIIGHEITHGFDNVGSHFDESGNARNWWDNVTFQQYSQKAECMIQQYSKFVLNDGLKINGQYTLKENIADNGAVKEAFRAYLKYTQEYGEELSLPGLIYTPRQLFFIATAQNWCSKSSPQMFKTLLETDSHSPGKARVNIALSNLKEFSESFNCHLKSPMNPVKKCMVW